MCIKYTDFEPFEKIHECEVIGHLLNNTHEMKIIIGYQYGLTKKPFGASLQDFVLGYIYMYLIY